MIRRRDFLFTGAVAATLRAQSAPRPRVESIVTISQDPEFYHGWATLAARSNGELLVAYSGGRESHVCPFGRVELIRSRDGGHGWSWPQVLMDSPIDDRDAGVLETPSRSLLVTTFTSLAYETELQRASGWAPEKLARWQAVNLRSTQEQRQALLDTWMLRSTDGGMTWSAPFRVPLNSPHGPIALSGGRLLYAGKQLWQPGRKVGVCESVDDGQTWRWLSDIPARPGDSVVEYHELHAVEAANGRVIVHIRNHNRENPGETLQSESTDGGKNWTTPHAIGVWGLPSHLLRLRDGRLLMSYGYRRAPFGNQARFSSDHGQTWSEPIIISDDGTGSDLGYPTTVEIQAGHLLTVWYESLKDSTHAVLRQARWSI
ncbi:MAG: sialidase family protein [Bryobacteraceae bacterium]